MKNVDELGLIQKYNITKTDGSLVDPNARYFVLRYDPHQKDPVHAEASRKALRVYAEEVAASMPKLSFEILSELDVIES
jgi:hypothetical protein